MENTNLLLKLGFNSEEALIYETLLERGQLNVLGLSKYTGLHRPALYRHLPRLLNKDIVTEVKRGKRVEYIAASPNKLEPLVERTKKSLDNIVSLLNTKHSKKNIVPHIEVFYGKDGVSRVFMDIVTTLDKGEMFYRYSVRKDIYKDFLPKEYRELRDSKKIERLVITNESGLERKRPKLERFVKVLKGDYDTFNTTKLIYQNKIAFVDYENEIAFVVFNERMAKMEKEIFMSLYKKL